MTEFVTVNGKRYLPSSKLSGIFAYTADYIGKLAREEKVLGMQIDRQWFVEEHSLAVHIHKIEVEKNYKKEALRAERRNERIAHERKSLADSKVLALKNYKTITVAFESLAVMFCGVLVGTLGWISTASSLTPMNILAGGSEVIEFVASHFVENIKNTAYLSEVTVATSDQEASATRALLEVPVAEEFKLEVADINSQTAYTVFPETGGESSRHNEVVSEEKSSLTQVNFSDQDHMRLVRDTKGEYYLEPILLETNSQNSVN